MGLGVKVDLLIESACHIKESSASIAHSVSTLDSSYTGEPFALTMKQQKVQMISV